MDNPPSRLTIQRAPGAAESAIAIWYADSPGAGSSLAISKPSHIGLCGARTAASLATQLLESIQGAPVGPASTSFRLPVEDSLMRGHARPVIAVCGADESHLISANGAGPSAFHSNTVRLALRASAAIAAESLTRSISRQLNGLPANNFNDAGSVQAAGQRNGTRLADDNGTPPDVSRVSRIGVLAP